MWQAAEELVAEVDGIIRQTGMDSANPADHLQRASESVLFNIAEGVAAYAPRVKVAAYEVAKREANEVRAILRRLVIKRALTQSRIHHAYDLAGAIVGMLTAAIISVSKRAGG